MEESLSREAVLDDIEEDTFIAFCEYGYRGFYSTPSEKGDESESRSYCMVRSIIGANANCHSGEMQPQNMNTERPDQEA